MIDIIPTIFVHFSPIKILCIRSWYFPRSLFTVTVSAITSQSPNSTSSVVMYTLKNCYIKAVKQNTAFSYDNSEPITVTADIWYQQREDWSYKEDEAED